MSVDPNNFGVIDFAFPVGSSGGACDYPATSDVAEGIVYAGGTMTGTLACGRGIPYDPGSVLLHSPAQIIQHLLISLNLGTDPADEDPWPVYAVNEKDSIDNLIVVYDTAGIDQGQEQPDGVRHQRYGIQLLVRASGHPVGYAKVYSLARSLDEGVYNNLVTISDAAGTATYHVESLDRKEGPPLSIGGDTPKSKRRMFTLNLTAVINRTS